MQSSNLHTHGFGNWQQLSLANAPTLLANLPTTPGVFVVRIPKPVTMKSGQSDIVFFGVGANQQGLQMRIRQVMQPGPSQSTNQRLLDFITRHSGCEVAVAQCHSAEAANALKKLLANAYVKAHAQLPPLMRSM